MTQREHYRETLLKITWDRSSKPSVMVPLGDFFCLGHGNHLANEMSSVAYWYADRPTLVSEPPPIQQRLPVLKDDQGNWMNQPISSIPDGIELNDEMRAMKRKWADNNQ